MAMPVGKADFTSRDLGVEPVGQVLGELAHQRCLGEPGDLLIGGLALAVAQVVGERAGDQEGVSD